MRLTKTNREKILKQNEGFTQKTYYEGNNFEEERIYTVTNGQVVIRSVGKTSWADSHFDDTWTASEEEVHRFLYKYKDRMNLDGIE